MRKIRIFLFHNPKDDLGWRSVLLNPTNPYDAQTIRRFTRGIPGIESDGPFYDQKSALRELLLKRGEASENDVDAKVAHYYDIPF